MSDSARVGSGPGRGPGFAALLGRLRKLQSMTVANGCSEAEAHTALGILARLLAEYQIDDTELSLREAIPQGCETASFEEIAKGVRDWSECAWPIAKLFHCRAWRQRRVEDLLGLGIDVEFTRINFFGLPEDTAAAVTMLQIVNVAISSETERWLVRQGKPRRGKLGGENYAGVVASFRAGMIVRLRERILELCPSPASGQSSGRALLSLKDQLVTEEFAKLGLRLRVGRNALRGVASAGAFAAGQKAGSGVRLGASPELHSGPRRLGQG